MVLNPYDKKLGNPDKFENIKEIQSANGWLSPEAFGQKYLKNLEGLTVHNTV